jgi:O-methyltransferase domain
MIGFSELEAAAIMAAYDFSTVGSVMDVGGGQGALATALLRTHPHLQAVIFDRTPATHDTQKLFALSGIAGRSKFIQGDFFTAFPGGGDLYLLKRYCTTGMTQLQRQSSENAAMPWQWMLVCSWQSV